MTTDAPAWREPGWYAVRVTALSDWWPAQWRAAHWFISGTAAFQSVQEIGPRIYMPDELPPAAPGLTLAEVAELHRLTEAEANDLELAKAIRCGTPPEGLKPWEIVPVAEALASAHRVGYSAGWVEGYDAAVRIGWAGPPSPTPEGK